MDSLIRIWTEKIELIDEIRSKFSVAENEKLKLPQIIVVGDQSSGKSSILQAISGVNLPRGVNTVTKCPVVMQMRKSTEKRIQIKYRSEPFKDISDTESEIRKIQRDVFNNTITKEPITISIQSPEMVTLTIIDLPGLVKADVQGQARDMIEKTHEIARDFMKQDNSLIICVLPANQDICTTTTIKEATQCNPDKSRIIGVLTKLDKLDAKEVTTIPEIIANRKMPIEKGYYGLIVSDKILGQTDNNQRSELEIKILKDKGLWKVEDTARFGLTNFIEALVRELVSLIEKTFPILKKNLDSLLKETNKTLETFSKYHGTEELQKKYIIETITDIGKKTKNLLVKGKHEISDYNNIKIYLVKNKILPVIQDHETFLYMWHEVFKNLYKNFNSIFDEFFNELNGIYQNEQYLEDIINKTRAENISIFISSKPFKKIVDQALTKFKIKSDECVETCFRIISFIIANVLTDKIEVKLSQLKFEIEKICFRILDGQKLEINNQLTFLFESERAYFSQDAIVKEYAEFNDENKIANYRNGRILCKCLKRYLTNTIHRLGDVVPNFIRHSLFINFNKALKGALQVEFLCSPKDPQSYFNVTDAEKREFERQRLVKISLEELIIRLNNYHC